MEQANAPKIFQVFTLDNYKLKISRFVSKVTIELKNLQNRKTYSYECDQDGSQKFPFFIESIPEFYQLIYASLSHLKEGYQARIVPDTKIELLYQVKTSSNKMIPLTFECPIKEIHPKFPIDFESKGVPILEFDVSVQSEFTNSFQNSLKGLVDQQNSGGIMLNISTNETNQILKEGESGLENIPESKNAGRQEQEFLKKSSDEVEERLKGFKDEIERKFQDKIQKIIQDYTRLNADVKNNKTAINQIETKIWGSSTSRTTPDHISQEPFEARLQGMLTESKNLQERLLKQEKNLIGINQGLSSGTTIEKLQQEIKEIKESFMTVRKNQQGSSQESIIGTLRKELDVFRVKQETEQALKEDLLDQFKKAMARENHLSIQYTNFKTEFDGVTTHLFENTKNLKNQISMLKEEIHSLENSKTDFEKKIAELDTKNQENAEYAFDSWRKVTHEWRKYIYLPSEKELKKEWGRTRPHFNPDLNDLSLELKNEFEISMNSFFSNSTKKIYSREPLPNSGKFMFSIKVEKKRLGNNGRIAFGAAPFQSQEEIQNLPGSFLIDLERGQASLGKAKARFYPVPVEDGSVLSIYIDLQANWIYLSINNNNQNNRCVFYDKICTREWKKDEIYAGIITSDCEELKVSFI